MSQQPGWSPENTQTTSRWAARKLAGNSPIGEQRSTTVLAKSVALTSVLGLPAAVLWWLLAPGGRILGDAADPMQWFPRDLVFGAVGVGAGIIVALVVFFRTPGRASSPLFLALIVGACLASLIAWQLGQLLGYFWVPLTSAPAGSGVNFTLRSWALLTAWPGALAVMLCGMSLVSLVRRAPVS
ncbi:hypothetical protein ACQR35_12405 [Pseudarthrobacter sp. J1738]|uniref:hypothetical protein n=1 Tax=Pseudarthrobacter sp. J1738 TaxID=3420446 RepID=UPI003D292940